MAQKEIPQFEVEENATLHSSPLGRTLSRELKGEPWGTLEAGGRIVRGQPFICPDSQTSVPTAPGQGGQDKARNSDNCASNVVQLQHWLIPKAPPWKQREERTVKIGRRRPKPQEINGPEVLLNGKHSLRVSEL